MIHYKIKSVLHFISTVYYHAEIVCVLQWIIPKKQVFTVTNRGLVPNNIQSQNLFFFFLKTYLGRMKKLQVTQIINYVYSAFSFSFSFTTILSGFNFYWNIFLFWLYINFKNNCTILILTYRRGKKQTFGFIGKLFFAYLTHE